MAATALLVEIVVVIVADAGGRLSTSADITDALRQPESRSARLFLTDHLLAFEVTSIILLVGAVGGVVLGSGARRRSGDDDEESGAAAVGQPPRPEAA